MSSHRTHARHPSGGSGTNGGRSSGAGAGRRQSGAPNSSAHDDIAGDLPPPSLLHVSRQTQQALRSINEPGHHSSGSVLLPLPSSAHKGESAAVPSGKHTRKFSGGGGTPSNTNGGTSSGPGTPAAGVVPLDVPPQHHHAIVVIGAKACKKTRSEAAAGRLPMMIKKANRFRDLTCPRKKITVSELAGCWLVRMD